MSNWIDTIRFRTIMAYPCYYNPPDGWSWESASPVNYFSNPEVSYLGLPTGTTTENNAETIRGNMVRPQAA